MSPSRDRFKRLGFAIVTAVAAGVLVLIAGELMTRASGYRLLGLYDAGGVLVEPRELGAEGGPFWDIDGVLYHFDFEVPWVTNHDGFREPEMVVDAPTIAQHQAFGRRLG